MVPLDSTFAFRWCGVACATQVRALKEVYLTAGRLCSLGSEASLLLFTAALCVLLLLWSPLQEDAPVRPDYLRHHPVYERLN